MNDDYGQSIGPGENYLKGNHLKAERWRNMSLKKFSIVTGDVLCDPEEVFESFVDITMITSLWPRMRIWNWF